MDWKSIPTDDVLEHTAQALKENGMEAIIVGNGAAAKQKLFELLPQGAEVMDMTSQTLIEIGAVTQIQESGEFNAVKPKLNAMDRTTQAREMQKLGAAPEWAVGSVHAITEDGHVLIASNTGSQLPAYTYAAAHVIWIVGAQKIVKNFDEGLKRIYDYVLPLESDRARKAYGVSGSNVNKLLVVNKEVQPGRITIILVKEIVGF